MKLYYVTMKGGYCMLTEGSDDIAEAQDKIYYAEGYNNVQSVRVATEEDIRWVRAMGGYVP